jgi:hypothetical protein
MVLPLPAIDFDGRDFRDLKDGEKVWTVREEVCVCVCIFRVFGIGDDGNEVFILWDWRDLDQ